MFSRGRLPWSRKVAAQGRVLAPVDALAFLPPELCATLAGLHEAPRSVAEAAIQLLPFGSRTALETLNPALAVAGAPMDEEGHRPLRLTPFAYEVMAAAAAKSEAEPRKVAEWSQRARQATSDITKQP